jgi:hypothetical protein
MKRQGDFERLAEVLPGSRRAKPCDPWRLADQSFASMVFIGGMKSAE